MHRQLTISSFARLTVTAAVLMIVGVFTLPAIAHAAPDNQDTSTFPPLTVSLPFVTSVQGGIAPSITSTPGLTATVGITYTYPLTVTGSPTPTVSLESGPEGMTIDDSGLIEWMPAASGIFSVAVVANNGTKPDAQQSFAIIVAGPEGSSPVITSTPGLTATLGVTYTYVVVAVGNPIPTVALEQRPEGMTVDESGLIEWKPAVSGTFSVTIVARNGTEPDAEQVFSIEVSEPEIPERIWDERLDRRGAILVEADVPPGGKYWRLVEARWLNQEESQGMHHILMDVLDKNGDRKAGVPLLVSWADGSATVVSEEKVGEPYAANYALYALAPAYNAQPYAGAPADRVEGMGLGELYAPDYGHHTSYVLTWQLTVMPR